MKTFITLAVLSALLMPDKGVENADHESTPTVAAEIPENHDHIDSTVVSVSRAGTRTPVAYTLISGEHLRHNPSSSSLPMELELQPSVVSVSEGGTGLGYTRMSVRGIRGGQINVTLNGITLNDAESHEVFWANIPALANVLSSVQLQRGIGTSAAGSGAFGASVNMSTASVSPDPTVRFEASAGSYRTFTGSFAGSTGILPKGFYLSGAYSYNSTAGYIRNGWAKVQSAMGVFGWMDEKNSVRATYLMGHQHTGITWEGISLEQYAADRRYNPAGLYIDGEGNETRYDNQSDNFTQHHLQINYTREFGEETHCEEGHSHSPMLWSTTFNYTRGDGFYEQYEGPVYQRWLRNDYYVLNSTFSYKAETLKADAGLNMSLYDGDHYRNELTTPAVREFANNGLKKEASVFARAEWSLRHWCTLYADLQGRFVGLRMLGPDEFGGELDYRHFWPFFNPRAGVNFTFGSHKVRYRAFISAALANREPCRSDLLEDMDLRPEKMVDLEACYSMSCPGFSASVNLYMMEYRDMLVPSGAIDEQGYSPKMNVSKGFRRGVELSASWSPLKWMTMDGNVTLSDNRLPSFGGNRIMMSPAVVGMARLDFHPWRTLKFSMDIKGVGRQYLDNTMREAFSVPAYYACNADMSYTFKLWMGDLTLAAYLNNFTNNLYYADGWASGDYMGIYPQAPMNFSFKIVYGF